MIDKASNYIKENKNNINKRFSQNFHLMPPIGWMNDPNGFSYFQGKYHLFYQHYPYAETWNSMHWGHAITGDFIKWEMVDVALAPDEIYDDLGCYSGTAIEHDNKLYLMYTGVNKRQEENYQEQAIASSSDGINFTKSSNNPVISIEGLPPGILKGEFRDPKIWEKDGKFYCVIVAMDEELGGRMLLYVSEDLEKWEYLNDFIEPMPGFGAMWECPDVFELGDHLMIMMSLISLPKKGCYYWNKHSCVYALTEKNDYNQKLREDDFYEIDCGFDFYAPQTVLAKDGRRIMVAWMQAWEDEIITQTLKHGWAGCMTLPREITIADNILIQNPVREIESYREGKISYENIIVNKEELTIDYINGKSIEIEMDMNLMNANNFTINMFQSKNHKTILSYNKIKEELKFDRRNSGYKIESKDYEKENYRILPLKLESHHLYIRIFIDISSVEIFLQRGEMTITSRIYPIDDDYGISFISDGEAVINHINKWDLQC